VVACFMARFSLSLMVIFAGGTYGTHDYKGSAVPLAVRVARNWRTKLR